MTTRERHLANALANHVLSLDLLPADQGSAMLYEIIQQPSLLQDQNQVARLLDLLGHLPLAIRLAASYIRSIMDNPNWVLDHFVVKLEAQAIKVLDTQPAQRGLAATFAISYDALTPYQQRLFGLTSIYSPPLLTVENIAGLLASQDELDRTALETELDGLVQLSLLGWREGGYTLHPLLAQYAYGCLQESGNDVLAIHVQAAQFLQAKLGDGDLMPAEMLAEVDQWGKAHRYGQFAIRPEQVCKGNTALQRCLFCV